MNSRIYHIFGEPHLEITADLPTGPVTLYYAPIDITDKHRTKLEIDWAHQKTGIPRPDLYDTIRAYTKGQPVVAGRPQRGTSKPEERHPRD